MTMILGQFVSLGVIAIVIIFQPEIRKFLLVIGNNAVKGNFPIFKRFVQRVSKKVYEENPYVTELHSAISRMARGKIGALIVILEDDTYPGIEDSGIVINAQISRQLILSIFNKESPLHDGAMLIYKDMILKASCILPVSDNINLPATAGLRHRAALGLSEVSSAKVFIVSEETGKISFAERGHLEMSLDEDRLLQLLRNSMMNA